MARSTLLGLGLSSASTARRSRAGTWRVLALLLTGFLGFAFRGNAAVWQSFFEDHFESNPLPTNRFLLRPVFKPNASGTARHEESPPAFVFDGHLSAFRTVPATCDLQVRFQYRYTPQPRTDAEPDRTELGLDLPDQSRITVQWLHSGPQGTNPVVRILMPGAPGPAREVPFNDTLLPTEWTLRYRHGWVELRTRDVLQISADLGRLGVPIQAVAIAQSGGILHCHGLEASGIPAPDLDAEARQRLQEAARINAEGSRLLNGGELVGALVKTSEASNLFLRVLGEEHHDTANSFANRATVADRLRRREEASVLWTKALAIHERTLGTNHPHTTLTRFGWGKHLLDAGETNRAWRVWWQCRTAWAAVQGSNAPIVLSLEKAYAAAGKPDVD